VRRWRMQCGHADTMAESLQDACPRIFLAGDAAHVVTPGGGFGLNLGVQDAQNLWWKLIGSQGYMSQPSASSGIIRSHLPLSYSAERSPHTRATMEKSLEVFHASAAIAARGFNLDMRALTLLRFVLRRLPFLVGVPMACLLSSCLTLATPKLVVPAAAMALAWQLTPAPAHPPPPPFLRLVDRIFYPFLSVSFARHVLRPSELRTGRARCFLADDRNVVRLLYPELDLDFQYGSEGSAWSKDWKLAPNVYVQVTVGNDPGDQVCHLRDLALRFHSTLHTAWAGTVPASSESSVIMLQKSSAADADKTRYEVIAASSGIEDGRIAIWPTAALGRIAVLQSSGRRTALDLHGAILRPDGLMSIDSQVQM